VTGVGDWFTQTALSGSMLLALPVALVAGLVSFFSPCVVPLLPGYLSYATGLSGADLESARRGRMVLGSLLFVLGFSFVFVAYGALFGSLGDYLITYTRQISIVLGSLTILLGIVFVGLVPWLQRDVRVHRVPAVGLVAAPLLGALFGLGWTPCIGPTLTAVQALAVNEGTAGRGALLSLAYSLGLGLPFLAAGLAFRRTLGAVRWVRRHQAWVTRLGGIMLIVVGVLLVTGLWDQWVGELRALFPVFEAPV
jgi:cytochrome c-type biogenesis protein